MISREQLIEKLTKDVEQLEKQITNREKYNAYNKIKRALIKSGIAVDFALPFILATVIISQALIIKNGSIFKKSSVTKKANVETIDMSDGTHIERFSYDFSYDRELLKYSTGWIINDKGLYQRTITSYKISKEIDLTDTDKIFSMNKEELDKILEITNIKTIQKSYLTNDDSLYNEDTLIVINHGTIEIPSDTMSYNTEENAFALLQFVFLSLFTGIGASGIKKILGKTYISDKLKTYEVLYRPIEADELLEIKAALEIKKQNLVLLTSMDETKGDEDKYSRTLKRG